MKHGLTIVFLVFMALVAPLAGCAVFSGGVSNESANLSTQYDDAGIKTSIASALLKSDAGKANDVEVHCFRGHVFLVGEADPEFRRLALTTARQADGVVHVTSHWFPTGTASTDTDSIIETEIMRTVGATGASGSNQLSVDVWGGHVVLVGLMKDQRQIESVVNAARTVPGVKSVTNYLASLPV